MNWNRWLRKVMLSIGVCFACLAFCRAYGLSFAAVEDPQAFGAAIRDGQSSAANSGDFVLVELFTSEGCSSCPSADRNLQRIVAEAQRDKSSVYCLSFHVDYWNNLGWKDPFSEPEITARQQRYAQAFHAKQVYTPQMIVNGSSQFVGSSAADSNKAIRLARELTATSDKLLSLSNIELNGKSLSVHYELSGQNDSDVLCVALVQPNAERNVTAGENSGSRLTHSNVVRRFEVINKPLAVSHIKLTLPSDVEVSGLNGWQVIGFLQNPSTMAISAATGCAVLAETATSAAR